LTQLLPITVAALLLVVIGGGLVVCLLLLRLREDLDTAADDLSTAQSRIDELVHEGDDLRNWLAGVVGAGQPLAGKPEAVEPGAQLPPAVEGPATAPAAAVIDAQHAALIERELGGHTFNFRESERHRPAR
jgi:hypothetical protein